jgi:hypothetical protein
MGTCRLTERRQFPRTHFNFETREFWAKKFLLRRRAPEKMLIFLLYAWVRVEIIFNQYFSLGITDL